jgi:hypothetical protein
MMICDDSWDMHDDDDDDGDDDDDCHGSHVHLHIESPPTWHFRNTQPFRNSGAEQRQGCTVQFSWAGFQPSVYMGRTWELHGFIADVLGI